MKKIYFLGTFFLLIGILPIASKAFDNGKIALLFSIIEDLTTQIDKKDVSGENKKDGFIRVKVSGGTSPYTIHCFSPYSIPSQSSGDELKLENIQSGDYLFVIQDSSGKTISKEVKIYNHR